MQTAAPDIFTYRPAPAGGYFGSDIAKAAALFDQENPRVYALFIRFSLQALAKGYRKFAAAAIFERIRWEIAIETTEVDFKLNNNHKAYFARKAMLDYPQLKGFFETRGSD